MATGLRWNQVIALTLEQLEKTKEKERKAKEKEM